MRDAIEVARSYIGTPFHHQGRLKGKGVDCIGFLVLWARELGYTLQDFTDYSRDPDGKTLIARLSDQLDPVPIARAKWGDVLAFWFVDPKLPQHVGVKTQHGIIHTNMGIGRVVEHGYTKAWERRTHSAWRLRSAA